MHLEIPATQVVSKTGTHLSAFFKMHKGKGVTEPISTFVIFLS